MTPKGKERRGGVSSHKPAWRQVSLDQWFASGARTMDGGNDAMTLWILMAKRASVDEMAEALGISRQEVRRKLRWALRRLLSHYLASTGSRSACARFAGRRLLTSLDPVTLLETRMVGERYLKACHRMAEHSGMAWATLFVDVDGLKAVNDRLGHAAGDRRLKEVAQGLRRAVRREDRVFRWGGDEFLVVLPNTDAATATALARRLKEALASLGVSVGVAAWLPGEPTWEAVVHRADLAMYRDKRGPAGP